MPAAITAVGAVSGHGLGAARLFAAVEAGRTAIRSVPALTALNLCSDLASLAPPDEELDAAFASLGVARPEDRSSRLLLAAAAEAWQGQSQVSSARRGVIVGTTKGALEIALADWQRGQWIRADPLFAPVAALVSAACARGPAIAISTACASSTMALGEALRWIEDGVCDEVVVGGTDAFHSFIYDGFHSLKALSPFPAAPFDLHRAGLSLGEGAAIIVLHSLQSAERQRLTPLGILEGFGAASDSYDQTAPDPRGAGLLAACRSALGHAGCGVQDVGAYHAHGTATLHNDRMEAAVCAALFGERPVPVCAIKGAVGHTLGASGLLDVVVALEALRRRSLPPVTNLKQVALDLPLHPVLGKPYAVDGGRTLIGSAGFGGVSGALVVSAGASIP